MTSLRREKDSLQLALNTEINNRRVVESENEQLRRQVMDYEREMREMRQSRDNLEMDLKNNVQRSNVEF